MRGGDLLKRGVIAVSVLALVAPLSGCSCSKKTGTTSGNKDAVTLTIWRAADDQDSFTDLVKNFQEDYPYVKINYVHKAEWKTNPDLYRQEAIDALATGRGPDILSIRSDWMPADYLKLRPMPSGYLASKTGSSSDTPNSTLVQKLFVPVVAKDVIYDCNVNTQTKTIETLQKEDLSKCQVYGLPLSVDSLGLYINQNILNAAIEELSTTNKLTKNLSTEQLSEIKKILSNGPTTWTDLYKIVPFITVKDGTTITRSAVAMGSGSNIEQAPSIISTLLMQTELGDHIVTEDLKAANFQNAIAGDVKSTYPGQGAINFYTRFAEPTVNGASNSYYTWSKEFAPNGARQAFIDGNLAMIIENSSFYATLKASDIKFQFNVLGMPKLESATTTLSYSTYWVEGVTTNSKASNEAWNFLAYAATKGVKPYLSNTKRPSALLSNSGEYDADATQMAVFKTQAQVADSWYKGPDANRTDEIFRDWADSIVSGTGIEEATNVAANQVTALLQSITPLSGEE